MSNKKAYFINNISFKYEGEEKAILDGVYAEIPKGEISLLLGESGAGKSTLISTLMRIIPDYSPGEFSGEFLNETENLTTLHLNQMAQKVGIVFQNPESQFCTYTVKDELAFGPENLLYSKQEIEDKILTISEKLSITHLLERPLVYLSGGEKQRVAIASVLICNPELIIFDEPTSNLDPQSQKEIFGLLEELCRTENKTILVVEHQLELLWEKVDNLILLGKNGKILFQGDSTKGLTYLLEQKDISVELPPAITFQKEIMKTEKIDLWQSEKDVVDFLSKKEIVNPTDMSDPKSRSEILSCNNLSLELLNRHVLKNITLSIEKSDFIGVLGPNGAGKTSLFHTLLGIYKNAQGELNLLGKPMRTYGKKKWKHIGISFQNPEWQFTSYSVESEVAFGLKKSKLSIEERAQKVTDILNKFSLENKREQNPYTLSQGEKRRLSVASMMVCGQEILLLDEPTFGQDRKNKQELMKLLREMNQEGVTILMISHDVNLVLENCNKAILMNQGECLYYGDTFDLFTKEKLCKKCSLEIPFWSKVSQQLSLINQKPIQCKSGEDAIAQFFI